MSAFVLDYDHNAPTIEALADTHEPFYQMVRQAQPHLPILIFSRPKAKLNEEELCRYAVIRRSYENAVKNDDRNVYFVDGCTFFDCFAGDCATVGGAHPNDFGFVCIAKGMETVLRMALKGEAF